MYYSYFGLREAPFSRAVNPRYLYMSPSHRDALAHLLYGVGAGGGFILLTGEVGTGKTTINRCLLTQMPDTADLAIVLNPALDSRDLLATVCEELEILPEGEAPGLKTLTDALHAFLLDNHARGRKTVLMIDEAQHLSFDVLEQIRLLTNLETNEEKLLHIILLGQPELAARLAQPELRQLNQRITARFDLQPLSVAETGAYIRHRLHVAGLPAGRELFSAALVRAIHRQTKGVPRLINLLCDRLLLGTYGQSADRPTSKLLRAAAKEVLGEDGGLGAEANSGFRAAALAAIAIAVVGSALWFAARTPPLQPSPATDRSAYSGAVAAPGSPTPDDASPAAGASSPPMATDLGDWFLAAAQANAVLAALYDLDASATPSLDFCRMERPRALLCERVEPQTWARLAADPRPALLELIDARRVEARAVFLGMEGEDVVLAGRQGPRYVSLAEVADLWTGAAWRLWRRPEAVERSLRPGDVGDDVAAVASLFARLDDQPLALGAGRYDERLEERVRLFQVSAGLDADGVLGDETLRRLVVAVGDDIDVFAARRRLQADGESRVPSGAQQAPTPEGAF